MDKLYKLSAELNEQQIYDVIKKRAVNSVSASQYGLPCHTCQLCKN